jgi:hypothetical protein
LLVELTRGGLRLFDQAFLDVDKNAGSAFIVVPIAAMTAMLNKRVMVMLIVEPTLVVMVICHGATRTDGNEESNQDGSH